MEPPAALLAPKWIGISGVLFSILYFVTLVLLRLSVPADPNDPGNWLNDPSLRDRIGLALHLVPFAGIAFLWFMAVLRNRIGASEDRLLSTVFLGSGLLFLSLLFAAATVARGLLDISVDSQRVPTETYRLGRSMAYTLMHVFATRMAAVFMFVTSSIGLRTGVLARWVSFVGFGCGIVLLLVISNFAWIALVFPLWVLVVSSYILHLEYRSSRPGKNDRPGVSR